jgi:hypothetical protein
MTTRDERWAAVAFCTTVEWDGGFSLEQWKDVVGRMGGLDKLPDGCRQRIVGTSGEGMHVIEVWDSPDAARAFAEQSGPKLAVATAPPPDRVGAFEIAHEMTRT